MDMWRIHRPFITTWFHLIQTNLPTGKSKVVATLCNYRSVEELKVSLQKAAQMQNVKVTYTVDPTPVYEPNRRCDQCMCGK